MPTLKNYTSTVPVERTLARIEAALAKAGATAITKDYTAGQIRALCFRVRLPDARDLTIRLPANEDQVRRAMLEGRTRLRAGTELRVTEQARRTAWKLMQDWVEVQLSLIAMQQAEFLEVFLPYAWDGKRTFYQTVRESHFKMLPAAVE